MFECNNCGAQYQKWEGRCRECGKWSTVEESSKCKVPARQSLQLKALAGGQSAKLTEATIQPAEVVSFDHIDVGASARISTGIKEFDRVLGGGIVPGSLVLVGGAPGIGKSTLLLQVITNLVESLSGDATLYVSGEESASQIKARFNRLGLQSDAVRFSSETIVERICAAIVKEKPKLTIVDSVQTIKTMELTSAAGSQNQVAASSAKLMETAKMTNVPIFLIGHITKSGIVAGPKTLEHLVDTVLYLEGDKNHFYRILRSVKNRFGSVDEIGVFEMTDHGLMEVANPSQAFLQDFDVNAPGTVTTVVVEGSRPLLVEIQALTSRTHFGYPKRATSGFKKSRLEVLIAILSKRLNINLGEFDVYLNVAGGLKITEPAADLAATAAIISSFKDTPLPPRTAIFGELGLGGEVRPVPLFDKRIREAKNLGFTNIITPKTISNIKKFVI